MDGAADDHVVWSGVAEHPQWAGTTAVGTATI